MVVKKMRDSYKKDPEDPTNNSEDSFSVFSILDTNRQQQQKQRRPSASLLLADAFSILTIRGSIVKSIKLVVTIQSVKD